MRNIQYYQLPPIGSDDQLYESTIIEFILDIPYLLNFGLVPPLQIFNEIFKNGFEDAGMSGGCKWEPFEIDQNEYEEIVKALFAMPQANYRLIAPPNWVRNSDDWQMWCQEYEMEIPHETFYRLSMEDNKWSNLKRQAEESGNKDLALEYHLKGLETGVQLVEFITPYINKYRERKGNR